MFVKRRKIVNFNNNDLLENKNYPFNKNVLTKFCLQHKFDCDGNSEEVIFTDTDLHLAKSSIAKTFNVFNSTSLLNGLEISMCNKVPFQSSSMNPNSDTISFSSSKTQ